LPVVRNERPDDGIDPSTQNNVRFSNDDDKDGELLKHVLYTHGRNPLRVSLEFRKKGLHKVKVNGYWKGEVLKSSTMEAKHNDKRDRRFPP
jgi:hypothetical protein